MQLKSCRATKATRVPGGGRPQGCKVDIDVTLNSENCNAQVKLILYDLGQYLISGRLNSNSQGTSLSLITTRMPVIASDMARRGLLQTIYRPLVWHVGNQICKQHIIHMSQSLGRKNALTYEVIVEAVVVSQFWMKGRQEVEALTKCNESLGFVGVIRGGKRWWQKFRR